MDTFNHVAWTYDKNAGESRLYINGILDNTFFSTVSISTNDQPLQIGRGDSYCCGVQFGFGTIDDVRIYDRALSTGEVEQLYLEGLGELVWLEIVGPDEVAEDWQAQYKAFAHYDNGGSADVTDLADWSVDDETVATIDENGLLTTEEINQAQKVIFISAEYTEGEITTADDKDVTVFAICPSGTALEFDGVNDYVEVNDSTSLDIVDEITITAWVYDMKGSGTIAFKKEGDCLQYGFDFYQNRLSFHYRTQCGSGVSYQHTYKSDSSISSNAWHHVAVRYESGDSASAAVFLDGIEIPGSWTHGNGSGEMVSMPSYLTIGSTVTDGGTAQAYFKGMLDEVHIYDRALSAEEIQASIYTKLAGDEDGLVAYWDLDEGDGEIAGDSSVNGNDGTIVGAEWVESGALIGFCSPVTVDIKPGSCPNPLNLASSGVLPVAVLGSESFDVSTIDPGSIFLEGVPTIRTSYEDVASVVTDANECECNTADPDGHMDLTLKFRTQDIVEELIYSQDELAKGQTLALTLTGELLDYTGVEGTDCVRLVGNVPKWLEARRWDVNGDGLINMADFIVFAENWLESAVP
jgi:hypothetical protein